MHDILDGHGNVIRTESGAYQRERTLLGKAGGDIRPETAGIAHNVDHQESGMERLLDSKESAQHGIEHIDDGHVSSAHERLDVAAKVDRDALGKCSVPGHPDSQLFPDSAAGAICCDPIA